MAVEVATLLEVTQRDAAKGILQLVVEVILFCILGAVGQGINLNKCDANLSGL